MRGISQSCAIDRDRLQSFAIHINHVWHCLFQVSHIHRGDCAALSLSKDGRHLLTAGDKVVKVWDYRMALDLNFQVKLTSEVDFN